LLYPDVSRIRDVSVVVTRYVIRAAQRGGSDREPTIRDLSDEELDEYIRVHMYDPRGEKTGLENELKNLLHPAEPASDVQAAAPALPITPASSTTTAAEKKDSHL
jgi:hypothetical protein